ncbi:MAG: radical SAM protein [Pseudomonadota bacterium]
MKILFVVYDNDSFISWFPQGIAYLASVCRKAGHNVTIYNQDVYHWPESHLLAYINQNKFDVIGVSACGGYYQYRKILKISDAINLAKNRPFYVLGGHLVAPEPEYFLKKTKADAVVIGEGEVTILELLKQLDGKKSLASINGIAYLDDGKFVQTDRRALIDDINGIPFPAWDLFPMDHYALLRMPNIKNSQRCIPVLSGRGCTFHCNFCYRMDKGFRPRSAESIIEEIQILKKENAISYIAFSDELLMSSKKRTVELCEAFIKANLDINWDCNGRLNYAVPEVLKVMKAAGCVFINYGIESMDQDVLRKMKKNLTTRQITVGIENTIATGISPGLNIIFGHIGDDEKTLKLGVDFLLKYSDHSQLRTIRPVTPYPGCPLYYHAIKTGLLRNCEDFYENKHLNSDLLSVNFTNLSDTEFHKNLYEANSILINNYYSEQIKKTEDASRKLYLENDASFRGFRHS